MRCPHCLSTDNRVIDTRMSKDGLEIRRRRVCNNCGHRFTTYERVAEENIFVVKRDGRREPFSREKVLIGLRKACEKRPVSIDILEKIVDRIETWAQEKGREISSSEIGERVMEELQELDEVAYVRFASVYRQFKDINQFMRELKELLDRRERRDVHRDS
ncbi:MAG: transcriptional regulator NrdR [Deltaproteobacteria bacterium]|nr:MAG: transcriptional regulator NrdR [Deltaproteobacteria bacterium]RLA96822.1 MAG: transcriptional regulator NrdR [Deltaproteobacteria bacterium]